MGIPDRFEELNIIQCLSFASFFQKCKDFFLNFIIREANDGVSYFFASIAIIAVDVRQVKENSISVVCYTYSADV